MAPRLTPFFASRWPQVFASADTDEAELQQALDGTDQEGAAASREEAWDDFCLRKAEEYAAKVRSAARPWHARLQFCYSGWITAIAAGASPPAQAKTARLTPNPIHPFPRRVCAGRGHTRPAGGVRGAGGAAAKACAAGGPCGYR